MNLPHEAKCINWISLGANVANDVLEWPQNLNGIYFIQSVYHVLMDELHSTTNVSHLFNIFEVGHNLLFNYGNILFLVFFVILGLGHFISLFVGVFNAF